MIRPTQSANAATVAAEGHGRLRSPPRIRSAACHARTVRRSRTPLAFHSRQEGGGADTVGRPQLRRSRMDHEFFFIGLFIVIYGVEQTGPLKILTNWLSCTASKTLSMPGWLRGGADPWLRRCWRLLREAGCIGSGGAALLGGPMKRARSIAYAFHLLLPHRFGLAYA
jgi:hypothetical protein